MFKVVEFEDASIGIIREEWLTPRKRHCLWPPHKINTKFNKCLATQPIPDENWTVYSIQRTFYETDDLSKAREKCKRAECDSEVASTDVEVEEKRKKRKRKIRTIHTDTESEYNEESDENCIEYPIPPKKTHELNDKLNDEPRQFLQDFNVDSPISSHSPTHEENHDLPLPLTPKSKQQSLLFEKVKSPLDSPTSSHTSVNEENHYLVRSVTPTTTLQSKLIQKTVLEKVNSSIGIIAEHLGHIKAEIQEIKQTQNDILLKLSCPSSAAIATLPVEIEGGVA